MAKEQNLSLNPTKISGLCDRLMCCLKYEQDHYEQTRKRMPRVGREIITPDGSGVINAINVLEETVRVRIAVGDSFELREYKIDDCQRPGQDERKPRPEEDATAEDAQQAAENAESGAAETCLLYTSIHRNTLEYQVRKMNAVIGGQPDEQKRFMMMCTYKMLALPDAGVPEL